MASVLWYLTLLHVKALGRIYVTVVVKGQTRDIELFLGGSMDWQKTCNTHADCFSLFLIILSYLIFMSYFLRRFFTFYRCTITIFYIENWVWLSWRIPRWVSNSWQLHSLKLLLLLQHAIGLYFIWVATSNNAASDHSYMLCLRGIVPRLLEDLSELYRPFQIHVTTPFRLYSIQIVTNSVSLAYFLGGFFWGGAAGDM